MTFLRHPAESAYNNDSLKETARFSFLGTAIESKTLNFFKNVSAYETLQHLNCLQVVRYPLWEKIGINCQVSKR